MGNGFLFQKCVDMLQSEDPRNPVQLKPLSNRELLGAIASGKALQQTSVLVFGSEGPPSLFISRSIIGDVRNSRAMVLVAGVLSFTSKIYQSSCSCLK